MSKHHEWESQQRIGELEHTRDSLASQNAKLRQERDEAIRSGYTSQEEATRLRNMLEAKQAEVGELKDALNKVGDSLKQIQDDSGAVQAKAIAQAGELLQLRAELAAVRSDRDASQQFAQHLSSENATLKKETSKLSGVVEERDELREQNRFLLSSVNLLKSQVGNYKVGTGKVGIFYYFLQLMGRSPVVGPLFRQTSEEVYDANQKQKSARK